MSVQFWGLVGLALLVEQVHPFSILDQTSPSESGAKWKGESNIRTDFTPFMVIPDTKTKKEYLHGGIRNMCCLRD